MKTLVFILAAIASNSLWACSCAESEETLARLLVTNHQAVENSIKINSLKKSYNYLFLIPAMVSGSDMECEEICSLKGIRLTAEVEYVKGNKVCSARLVKPGYTEEKTVLKKISCH